MLLILAIKYKFMHLFMHSHVLFSILLYCIFTYIGVEKKNDDCRRIHLQKSNKWDAATDVLLVSKRLETLSELERAPRVYHKRNAEYWHNEIKEKRANQRYSHMHYHTLDDPENTEDMSSNELRDALKEMGIKTRVRNVKRLQELYRDAIREQQNQIM